MTTYAQMVDNIIDQLQAFTATPDYVTSLTLGINATDLTVTLDEPAGISRGFLEIGDELLWVKAVDQTTGVVTVAPFGRGYRGTTAAAHAAGALVAYSPTWTRNAVKREINNQILAVYPLLYGVKAAPLITADATTYQFGLPADAERVVDVRWKDNATDGWQRSRAWEIEHSAPTEFVGGRYVCVYDRVPSSASIQVLYACRPTALSAATDVYTTVTGLDEGTRDLVELGVMARLTRYMDSARLADQTVQADMLDQPRAVGSATNVGNDLYRQYQIRLASEQQALSTRFPARYHRTR